MALEDLMEFLAKVQACNRMQVPVLVRWRHTLEPGQFLRVQAQNKEEYASSSFYARLSVDGRFTIPHLAADELEAKPGAVLEITLTVDVPNGDS